MKVREDRGDGSSTVWSGGLFAPDPWIQVGEQELIHRVIDSVGFEQDTADFLKRLGGSWPHYIFTDLAPSI